MDVIPPLIPDDPQMREISPAENMSADEFLIFAPAPAQERARQIRVQKREGARPRPSARLVDRSVLLTLEFRAKILDAVAALVDENLFGRSEMCIQFAGLLQRALVHLDLPARTVVGWAIYYSDRREIFRWQHAWVRVDEEVIDGNVDSLFENPIIPQAVDVAPYWGPIAETPADRKLCEDHGRNLPPDNDVSEIWWPELRASLDTISIKGSNKHLELTDRSRGSSGALAEDEDKGKKDFQKHSNSRTPLQFP